MHAKTGKKWRRGAMSLGLEIIILIIIALALLIVILLLINTGILKPINSLVNNTNHNVTSPVT